jgi:hypothetical protein
MCEQAYRLGRDMIWERSAERYMGSFQRTRLGRQDQPFKPLAVRTLAEQQADLPDWRLDHLLRLTDATGILQHATHTIPNFAEGYCTDDNARALMLTVFLEEVGQTWAELDRLATRYAAVLQAAYNPETKRFRNFLGFDRRWLEEIGSEDSHGRALWTLGTCVGRSRRRDLPAWAATHFEQALPAVLNMTSPRAWAFGLLGIREYLGRFGGDRLITQVRDTLTARLIDIYDRTATPDWAASSCGTSRASGAPSGAERTSSPAAAALGDKKLRQTTIPAAVGCSDWFGKRVCNRQKPDGCGYASRRAVPCLPAQNGQNGQSSPSGKSFSSSCGQPRICGTATTLRAPFRLRKAMTSRWILSLVSMSVLTQRSRTGSAPSCAKTAATIFVAVLSSGP